MSDDIFKMYKRPEVSMDGVDAFRAILDDTMKLEGFLASRPSEVVAFLEALTRSCSDGLELAAFALMTPRAVNTLATDGDTGDLLDLIETLPPVFRARVLAMPYAVSGLCADDECAHRVYKMMRNLSAVQRHDILAADGAEKTISMFVEEVGMANLRSGQGPTRGRDGWMPRLVK